MCPVPRPPARPVTRRAVLLAGAGLVLTGAAGCRVIGDASTDAQPPPGLTPDPLLDVAAAARADAVAAEQLAALLPDQAAGLRVVAAERTAHAQALEAEIGRAAGATPISSPASSPTPPPAATEPTVAALRAALQRNQDRAAELASTVPAYRAGLLGAVAAGCAAELAVLL